MYLASDSRDSWISQKTEGGQHASFAWVYNQASIPHCVGEAEREAALYCLRMAWTQSHMVIISIIFTGLSTFVTTDLFVY